MTWNRFLKLLFYWYVFESLVWTVAFFSPFRQSNLTEVTVQSSRGIGRETETPTTSSVLYSSAIASNTASSCSPCQLNAFGIALKFLVSIFTILVQFRSSFCCILYCSSTFNRPSLSSSLVFFSLQPHKVWPFPCPRHIPFLNTLDHTNDFRSAQIYFIFFAISPPNALVFQLKDNKYPSMFVSVFHDTPFLVLRT